MPRRQVLLVNDAWYHVYNRSVGKERIFTGAREIARFYNLIDFYRFPADLSYSHLFRLPQNILTGRIQSHFAQRPLLEIHAYAIMPNHYHFLVKQVRSNGIKKFIGNLQNGYAKYFNQKGDRYGSLFCSNFKAKLVQSEEEWIHVLRYIELNPVTAKIIPVESLESYPHTSFRGRYGKETAAFIHNDMVHERFSKYENYREFICNQVEYQIRLKEIKHLLTD